MIAEKSEVVAAKSEASLLSKKMRGDQRTSHLPENRSCDFFILHFPAHAYASMAESGGSGIGAVPQS